LGLLRVLGTPPGSYRILAIFFDLFILVVQVFLLSFINLVRSPSVLVESLHFLARKVTRELYNRSEMRKNRICCEKVVVEGRDAGQLRATRFGLPADVIMMFSLSGLVKLPLKRKTAWCNEFPLHYFLWGRMGGGLISWLRPGGGKMPAFMPWPQSGRMQYE
jgi:hypothetical protein